MKKIPFNPYIVGNPIKTKEMFFGREDDFQFVARKIGSGKSNQVLVFCGDRRSGKTSILFQILGGRLGDKFLPVLIDMQILAGIKDDYHFFRSILKVSCSHLKPSGLTMESLEGSQKLTSIEDLFENFLTAVENIYPDKILLFLLDEYELIEEKIRNGSLSESSVHYLSGALESTHKLSFIFTGSTNLEDRKVSFWKALLGKSIYRKISYLSKNDTTRLITEPLSEYLSFPDDLIDSIFRLTGGQPFYTQVICQNMVDHLIEEERNDPDRRDLNRIVKDIIDNPLPQMIYSWNSLSNNNKLILACLGGCLENSNAWANAGLIISYLKKNKVLFQKEKILVLLEDVYHKEILEKENDQYRFRMDLLRRWIKREHSIWKVSKETGLEFKKKFNPVIAVSALLVIVIGAAGAIFITRPSIIFGKEAEPETTDQIVQEVQEAPEKIEQMNLKANTGPFRVVIDGSLNLTSEGQEDENIIVVPTIEKGKHSFLFHNSKTGEEIRVEADIHTDSQIIKVDFKAPVKEEKKPVKPVPKEEKPAIGSIFITSIPHSACILLNGKDTGLKTPSLFENIEAAEYQITLTHEGYKPLALSLTVEKDKTIKKELTLIESYGNILFDVRPTAKILLDGKPLIETPYVKPVKVQTGKHILTLVNEALDVKKNIEIELKEGQIIKIEEVLK